MEAEGLPPMAEDDRAQMAERPLPGGQFSGHHLLRRAKEEKEAQQPG